MDDVIANKTATVERCVARIREEYLGHEEEFETNFTRQDSIILNLQRACEATIDIGMRLVRLKQLGLPQSSRDIFDTLEQAKMVDPDLAKSLKSMVGFRNIAVHDYRKLNTAIVRHLVEQRLPDLLQFCKLALNND